MKRLILAGFLIAGPALAQTEGPVDRFFDATAFTLDIARAAAVTEACGLRPHVWALEEIGSMVLAIKATAKNIWGSDNGDVTIDGLVPQTIQLKDLSNAYHAALSIAPGECAGFEMSINLKSMDKMIGWTTGQTVDQN